DGVKTAVRIIDQLNRQATGTPPPAVMEPFTYSLGLMIRVKAGAARGTLQVRVKIRKPSNETAGELSHPIHLTAPEDGGVDIASNFPLLIDEAGTWWFDVYVNDEKWTRVPLRVVYLPHELNKATKRP